MSEDYNDLLKGLNEEQKKGVLKTEGPVLILAGAGSGKTRVLTHRVAYLIKEKGESPYNIMAITFTNKAAQEMKERINDLLDFGGEAVWAATFHSSCVRILRRFADRIGYGNNFTIYDSDDSKTVMNAVLKKLSIDNKKYSPKMFLNAISSAKNELINPEDFINESPGDFMNEKKGQVYREYQASLRSNNALDFDDLIMQTVLLLRRDNEVLSYYQNKFHYVMVDEYQDTNTAQFELVRLLAGGKNNLCVVGDDDQSIYKFRGANIFNILNFEKYYKDAVVIKLEQNYRSNKKIIKAANDVIKNNKGRKEKTLWTDNEEGEKVLFKQFDTAYEEAEYIVSDIGRKKRRGEFSFKDCAILYRTNIQSRILEERFIKEGIPYKIVGGINFYSRKEVKDMLSYLKTIDNAVDDLAVQRIINVPKRGIGQTTVNRVISYAAENNIKFFDAVSDARDIPGVGNAAKKLYNFSLLIASFKEYLSSGETIGKLIKKIFSDTGYEDELRLEGTEDAKNRIENIEELISKAVSYQESADEPTLSGFLEEVALVSDIDSLSDENEYVTLMTIHSAKGLEFENVYISGMEDGLFPNELSRMEETEMEEERRLCYVGITRAKKNLTLTAARMRMIRGETRYNNTSVFVREIDKENISGEIYEPKRFYGDDDIPFKKTDVSWQEKRKSVKNFGTKIEKNPIDYKEGDRVFHTKFGEGVVTMINDGGRDYEVTVSFDRAGTKKMFASFAKLVKL